MKPPRINSIDMLTVVQEILLDTRTHLYIADLDGDQWAVPKNGEPARMLITVCDCGNKWQGKH